MDVSPSAVSRGTSGREVLSGLSASGDGPPAAVTERSAAPELCRQPYCNLREDPQAPLGT